MVNIGIISGSGVYCVFGPKETVKVHTPYGRPSARGNRGDSGCGKLLKLLFIF